MLGKPLDRPEYAPFRKKMNELGKPIWLHPARTAAMTDYPAEAAKLRQLGCARSCSPGPPSAPRPH